jgi:hypothetical protein
MTPDDETYKPDMLIYGEHYCALTDSLGICKFSTTEEYSLLPEDLAPGLAALGIHSLYPTRDAAALLQIGERIVNLERLYNVREGFRRKDDHVLLTASKGHLEELLQAVDRLRQVARRHCQVDPAGAVDGRLRNNGGQVPRRARGKHEVLYELAYGCEYGSGRIGEACNVAVSVEKV